MLNILVRSGARFDLQDTNGQTCLHMACQPHVADSVLEFIVNACPDPCLNLRNQFGGTPLDLIYLATYEQGTATRMRRLHLLLSRKGSKLTRYGMREPNLIVKKQYKLLDILASKEFLFKYRLRDLFDPAIRSLTWCIFLFYDVLRVCEQPSAHVNQRTIQARLERYLISMIENGEIPLDKLIFRPTPRSGMSYFSSSSMSSSTPTSEFEQQILMDTQNSLMQMAQIKNKLRTLRTQTLTLKAICRIHIKKEIHTFPNDIVKLTSISKLLQAYLTFYNPFVKAEVVI